MKVGCNPFYCTMCQEHLIVLAIVKVDIFVWPTARSLTEFAIYFAATRNDAENSIPFCATCDIVLHKSWTLRIPISRATLTYLFRHSHRNVNPAVSCCYNCDHQMPPPLYKVPLEANARPSAILPPRSLSTLAYCISHHILHPLITNMFIYRGTDVRPQYIAI